MKPSCLSYTNELPREARRANASLRRDNLNDTLEIVLRPDGTKSAVYPVNLNSLFNYSRACSSTVSLRLNLIPNFIPAELLRRLLRDYGVHEDSPKEKNLNRFMSHIGTLLIHPFYFNATI